MDINTNYNVTSIYNNRVSTLNSQLGKDDFLKLLVTQLKNKIL